MEDQQEKWIDDVLSSFHGIERAKPAPTLFARIQSRLDTKDIVPIRLVRSMAAAAAFLFFLNYMAINHYISSSSHATEQIDGYDDQSLISNFNLYE